MSAKNIPCSRCGVNEGEVCKDFNHKINRCNNMSDDDAFRLITPEQAVFTIVVYGILIAIIFGAA